MPFLTSSIYSKNTNEKLCILDKLSELYSIANVKQMSSKKDCYCNFIEVGKNFFIILSSIKQASKIQNLQLTSKSIVLIYCIFI